MHPLPRWPPTLVLVLAVVLISRAGAEDTTPPATDTASPRDPAPSPWLEAVRAQRLAVQKRLDARREATRRAFEEERKAMRARQALIDPRGAQISRMHDERIKALEKEAEDRRKEMEQLHQRQEPALPPPPGWSNPWYYRGY